MFRSRIVAATVVALLSFFGLAACDKEDERDAREGVNNVEQEVDDADNDGKDD